ncbi:hypothetical protein J6E39_09460 [bacterium]|nr:hypothetical protein [bacterium]
MDNSINFTGGFLIKNPSAKVKQGMAEILTGHKHQIKHDFNKAGDSFCLTKSYWDKDMACYILDNNLNFSYYPELTAMPAAKKLNDESIKCISSPIHLEKLFEKNYVRHLKYKDDGFQVTRNIISSLKMDGKDYSVAKAKKYVIIRDKSKNERAYITYPGAHGFSYAYILPETPGGTIKRYAFDAKANRLFDYTSPSGIQTFHVNFKRAVAERLNQLNNAK